MSSFILLHVRKDVIVALSSLRLFPRSDAHQLVRECLQRRPLSAAHGRLARPQDSRHTVLYTPARRGSHTADRRRQRTHGAAVQGNDILHTNDSYMASLF